MKLKKFIYITVLISFSISEILLAYESMQWLRNFTIIYGTICILYISVIDFRRDAKKRYSGIYLTIELMAIVKALLGIVAGNKPGLILIDYCLLNMIPFTFHIHDIIDIEFENSLKMLAGFSFVCSLYSLFFFNYDISILIRRGYTWHESFYYAVSFWVMIPYALYKIVNNKVDIKLIILILLMVLVNLLFLKRMIFVDVLLLLIVGMIYGEANRKAIFVVIIAAFIIYMIIPWSQMETIGEAMIRRFMENDSSYVENDRAQEASWFLADAHVEDIIFGKSLGNQLFADRTNTSLHIGWINFINKGGILYFLFMFFIWIAALRKARYLKNYQMVYQWALLLIVVEGFRFFYSNMWSFTPEYLFFSYAIVIFLDSKKYAN